MTERAAEIGRRLADPEPEVRRLATGEIASLAAPESCELLLVALADPDWRVRKEAASVAPRVEPRTAVVFAVARALGERDAVGLRNAAVEALVGIGPDAVPGAVDALGRLDADGRKLAVEVLAGTPSLTGMRALVRALGDADPNVVVAAVEGLGRAHQAGEEAREIAVCALSKLLDGGDTLVCMAALDALRRLEADVPWAVLEPLARDPLLRRSAIAVAGGDLSPRALRALANACADPSETVARAAADALGRSIEAAWGNDELLDVAAKNLQVSAAARAHLRSLAKAVDDPEARGAAVLALGLVRDPDDVALLVDALADDAVADRAEAALHLFGANVVEPLLVAGRTAAPSLRGATLSMLPELAPAQPSPLAAVREALSDPSVEVVAPALKSLASLGGEEDLAAIWRHVSSGDPKVSGAAQAALSAVSSRHPGAARALLREVDPLGDHALAAALVIEALARTGASEPSDERFLASAVTHRDARVRKAAVDGLGAGADTAAPVVTLALADEEPLVAHAAVRALGHLGRAEQLATLAATTKDPSRLATVLRSLKVADATRAVAAALPLLRSPEPSVAAAAVEVVGSTVFGARVEALMDATSHPDHGVVRLALTQLTATGDERALASLSRAIDHPAEAVRKYAAELLGQEPGAEAEGILRARLDRERAADVRAAIMAALASRRPDGAA